MASCFDRRDVLTFLGSSLAVWPLAARAEGEFACHRFSQQRIT